jgi:RimJ/RimL family protein N-acetyltransferase
VVLTGSHVLVEPLALEHVPDLAAATAGDLEVWQWITTPPADEAQVRAIVEAALADPDRFPFAVVELSTGRAVGSSSFLDIAPADERIEVGWTFYGRRVWRSAVNTETKLLLLGHAFDTLGYDRVALKTHHRNERSQAAISRLGAVREGTLRHHKVHWDGTRRDSVYYSILAAEWPAVRDRLRDRLAIGGAAS